MKTIKIIGGAYGHRKDGTGSVCVKTSSDPPFEVDDKEAKRLVGLKVAKIAEKADEKPPKPVNPAGEK